MYNCPHCDAPIGSAEKSAGKCHLCGGFLSADELPPADNPAASELLQQLSQRLPPQPPAEPRPSIGEIARSIVGDPQPVKPLPASVSSSASVPPVASDESAKGDAASQAKKPAANDTSDDDAHLRVTALWSDEAADSPRPGATLKGSSRETHVAPSHSVPARELVDLGHESPRASDYELLHVIGEGGVGVVYAARQTSIDRTVAVKMLRGATSAREDHRDKLLSEAVVTGELDHPNIVPVYELGAGGEGALFYSMKRVQGTPWSEVIAQKSLAENLDILMKTADAVAFAHSRGVVHRDIKPENIMLGDFGEVLLMDWGIALTLAGFSKGALATHRHLAGTPAYMAPEMALGPVERIGPASDVYLLGAVLFEIVTGGPPHAGGTVLDCIQAAARNEIQPTEKSGELLDVARRALAAEPEQRYASVAAFQAALREYRLHAESVQLAQRGDAELAAARVARDYRAFARAVSCYEEALVLWPDYGRASAALDEATLAYAECALTKGDYELGLSLLDDQQPSHAPLRRRLARAQRERDSRQQRLTRLKQLAVLLLLVMLAGAGVSIVWIQAEARRARRAESIAKRRQGELARSNGRLERARRELQSQNVALAVQTAAANAAKKAADDRRKDAESAQAEAEAAAERERRVAYVAAMNLAAEKIDTNAFGQARQQLEAYESGEGQAFRHWEWGRLAYLLRLDRRAIEVSDPLSGLAANDDGDTLLARTASGKALLVADGGASIHPLPHAAEVRAVALSPDGALAATGDEKGVVRLWTLDKEMPGDSIAQEPARELNGHRAAVLALAFSRDGRRLVSGSADRSLHLWNPHQGSDLGGMFGHLGPVRSVAISPEAGGGRVVSAGDDGSVMMWSIAERRRLVRFGGHRGPVHVACFSRDGRFVLSGGDDRRLLRWRPEEVPAFDFTTLVGGGSSPPAPFEVVGVHEGAIRAIEQSPDGRLVASSGDDGLVKVWTSPPGDEKPALVKTLRGHAGPVFGCRFLGDSDRLASCGRDGQLKWWSVSDYAEAQLLAGHEAALHAARFSHDGRHIVTAGRDGVAALWDARRGVELGRLQEGHAFLAAGVSYFPDGSKLLTAAADNSVRLWDAVSGGQIRVFVGAGRSGATALSGDAALLATGGRTDDGAPACKVWNIDRGELLAALPHEAEVTAVAFAPRTPLLLTGDAEGKRILWRRADDGQWRRERESDAHRDRITCAAFLPDGRRVLTASLDQTVGQWDVSTGEEPLELILKHDDGVTSLAVSPDGKHALTATTAARVRLWDVTTADRQGIATDAARVDSVAFSPDGMGALMAVDGRGLLVVDLSTARPGPTGDAPPLVAHPLKLAGRTGAIWSAAYAPEGASIVTVGGNRASLWKVDTGERLRTFGPSGVVASARFSNDDRFVVTSGGDGAVRVWRIAGAGGDRSEVAWKVEPSADEGLVRTASFASGGEPPQLLLGGSDGLSVIWSIAEQAPLVTFRGHTGPVNDAELSADGRRVVTASDDGTARLWDARTGEALLVFAGEDRHLGPVLSAELSADGTRVITGVADGVAKVWDAENGRLLVTLTGHGGAVTSACFSHDRRRALTGSEDRTAKVWMLEPADTPDGRELLTLRRHTDAVTGVAFSPDDRTVLTASRDGTAIEWRSLDWKP